MIKTNKEVQIFYNQSVLSNSTQLTGSTTLLVSNIVYVRFIEVPE